MDPELEQFLEDVDDAYDQVKALAEGRLDVPIKAPRKPVTPVEEVKQTSRSGKGQKFDTYVHFCNKCFTEYLVETPECPACHIATMTADERRADLMVKVAKLQQDRALKASKKMRWENWKKTQAMLHRKTSTNYHKWDYFEDEEDEPVEEEFVPPANDPNFKALELDIKQRANLRKQSKLQAEKLKEKGNNFYREGKYRNALLAYEEALNCKKDWLVLYTNAAITRIKLEDYDGAIKDCVRVLDYCEVFEDGYEKSAESCFKALSRKAMAHCGLNQFSEAVSALQTALTLKEDEEARTLLERCKADAALLPQVEANPIEISDAEAIIQELQTEEQVIEFNANGGGAAVVKAIWETKDENALKVLEHLTGTEVRWYYLSFLVKPVYDKRRTGAVVLLQALERSVKDVVFAKRIVDILAIAIEHREMRQNIVKHSAFTKGKKFVKLFYELFFNLPRDIPLLQAALLMLSNLSLTVYVTPLNRTPNPGSLKSLILNSWEQFLELATRLAQSETCSELMALLCNISTEKALQEMLLAQQGLLSMAIITVMTSTNSLALERALGLLTNCCSSADLETYTQPLATAAYPGCSRMLGLAKSTPEISRRSLLLLVKLLTRNPEVIQQLKADDTSKRAVINGLDNEATVDASTKILALACADSEFAQEIDAPKIVALALYTLDVFLTTSKLEERATNLSSLLSRLAECQPLDQFKSLIEPMVNIIRDKTGPTRKNCGVAVAKFAKSPENLEELRRVHGIEVLSSVAKFLL